jgi:hypothetical protein
MMMMMMMMMMAATTSLQSDGFGFVRTQHELKASEVAL